MEATQVSQTSEPTQGATLEAVQAPTQAPETTDTTKSVGVPIFGDGKRTEIRQADADSTRAGFAGLWLLAEKIDSAMTIHKLSAAAFIRLQTENGLKPLTFARHIAPVEIPANETDDARKARLQGVQRNQAVSLSRLLKAMGAIKHEIGRMPRKDELDAMAKFNAIAYGNVKRVGANRPAASAGAKSTSTKSASVAVPAREKLMSAVRACVGESMNAGDIHTIVDTVLAEVHAKLSLAA